MYLKVLCWAQLSMAAVLFFIGVVADFHAPSLGFTTTSEGIVSQVDANSAADRLAIRKGDRVVEIDGRKTDDVPPPLYGVPVGEAVTVVVSGAGLNSQRAVRITTISKRAEDAGSLTTDLPGLLRSFAVTLRIIANVWVLLLAVLLLTYRSDIAAARVAAMAFAFWVGGNLLIAIPGFGSLMAASPRWVEIAVHLLDVTFLSSFFGVTLHFALIFPRPFPFISRSPSRQYLAYAASAPILILLIFNVLTAFSVLPFNPLHAGGFFSVYAPLLLLGQLVLFSLHFRQTTDQSDHQRLLLVFLSSVPGLIAWVISMVLGLVESPLAQSSGSVVRWLGAMAGSAIFCYALARHRLFDFRPMLRRTLRYALARGTVVGSISLPVVALIVFLWRHRFESLDHLLSRQLGVLVLLLIPLVLILRARKALKEALERRFFREDFESRQTLIRLVSMIQRGADTPVLERVAMLEIEKALHPRWGSLWRLDAAAGSYRPVYTIGEERESGMFPQASMFLQMLAQRTDAVEFEWQRRSITRRFPAVEREWLESLKPALAVPMSLGKELAGFLLLGPRESDERYTPEAVSQLEAVAAQLAISEDYARLERLARKDPLTEALNRHAFYSLLEGGSNAGDRGGSVAVVDVNDLKKINDTRGHTAGDRAIRRVAAAIRALIRADDLLFRWGGDEFLVVLFGLDETEVHRRLATVNQQLMKDQTGPLTSAPVSVSVGVAPFNNSAMIQDAIEHADRAMYLRKEASRS